MSTFERLAEAVIDPDAEAVETLVRELLEEGHRPRDIIERGLIAGMDVVGERFRKNEMFIPEVMMSARAMHAGLDVLRPLLTESDAGYRGVFVICTVKGDVHDIGKNLVAMMFEGAGFKVIDLGTDVPPEKVVEAVREHGADLVGLSTLLTTTLDNMKETVEVLRKSGLEVKVMVGGAAVTQEFAEEIGAGYAENANEAVALGRTLMEEG
ncbi:MAG: cobalamin-binding protein [Thermoproteota archaeon]|nr:MAG: cobalamin-binding protein [Candidatus Korarchaeota archaeon]